MDHLRTNPAGTVHASADVVVVGGGPAGLSAAKILARSCRSVLLVDSGSPRNAPAAGVHNYLSAEGTPPRELLDRGRAEAARYGVEVVAGRATGASVVRSAEPGGPRFRVELVTHAGVTSSVGARRLVLATGLVDVLPDVEGLAGRWGRDVLHCPFCHGWEVRGQSIGVLGTSPLSLHQVMLFRQLTEDVVYFQHTAPQPTDDELEQLEALGVTRVEGRVVAVETTGDTLSGVRMADGRTVARQAIVTASTVAARQDLLADLGLATVELEVAGVVIGHHLAADPSGLTATAGVWAAGNLAAPMAQVVTSAASGSAVGAAVHLDLIAEDTELAVAAHRARAGLEAAG